MPGAAIVLEELLADRLRVHGLGQPSTRPKAIPTRARSRRW
jgi:hypothetical protein